LTRDRKRIHFTFEGVPVLSFYIDKTRDGGLVLGPELSDRDIHLTAWAKDGKIRSHIRHVGVEDSSPLGRIVSTRVASDALDKLMKRRVQPYHGNVMCYVFTRKRWQKIKAFLPKLDELGNLVIPVESFGGFLDMDFDKKTLWKKTNIRSLLSSEPNFGFIETRVGIRKVIPLSQKFMLVWPLTKVDELGNYIMKVIGIDDFFDYLESIGASKEIRDTMIRKIKEQHEGRKPKID
jgi:hypothetical protein